MLNVKRRMPRPLTDKIIFRLSVLSAFHWRVCIVWYHENMLYSQLKQLTDASPTALTNIISPVVGFSMFKTHWGRETHIPVGKLTTIGSDNGLLPEWLQAIIWTSAGMLSIGPLGANFSEILIGIQNFSIRKMHLKMSPAKWRLFCSSQCVKCISLKGLHRMISWRYALLPIEAIDGCLVHSTDKQNLTRCWLLYV